MGIDPDTPAPRYKYGDFATGARTEPAEPPKPRQFPEGSKPAESGRRRLLLGLAVAVVVAAAAAFFVLFVVATPVQQDAPGLGPGPRPVQDDMPGTTD